MFVCGKINCSDDLKKSVSRDWICEARFWWFLINYFSLMIEEIGDIRLYFKQLFLYPNT
jgi:hypothetical protein